MKIKKEHYDKSLIVKGKTYLLGELHYTQVRQFVAAGYIKEDYLEPKKPRKKRKDAE